MDSAPVSSYYAIQVEESIALEEILVSGQDSHFLCTLDQSHSPS